MIESGYENVVPVLDLGLNRIELVVAVRRGSEDILHNPPKRPILIATEYEHIADHWAQKQNLAHITIQTYGSTEAYAPEDADIVFDCSETGRTIAANNLVVIERLFSSTTHLVANRQAMEDKTKSPLINELCAQLRRKD